MACFEEPNTTGGVLDIDAPRNAPMKTPIDHLDKVFWHSTFDQFELAYGPTNVTINHTTLAGSSTALTIGSLSYLIYGSVRTTDILLLTHSLGYKPRVKVAIGGKVVAAGQIIQDNVNYRRSISVHTTTTGVYLRETAYSSNVALPAHSQDYRVYVFAQTTAVPGAPKFSKSGSLVTVGKDAVRSDRRYLRRTGVGDEEFSIDSGPTIDIDNGAKRVANGGVLTTETGYGGSMAAPPHVKVGL